MDILSRFLPIRRALEIRNYRNFILGSFCSSIGTWVQRIAVGWLTWELTRSGTWLGIIALADVAPAVVLAPVAGVVADRLDKLRMMKILQGLALVQASLLCLLTLAGWITIELLFILALVQGFIVSVQQPVRLAIVPALVGRDQLSAAIALNALSFNMARFLGPAVAGPIIVLGGVGPAFAVNALSYLVFIFALNRVVMVVPERTRPRAMWREMPGDIAGGYRYAVSHAGIGKLLLLLTVIAFFARPFHELLPGFADAVFGRGADGLALMTSAVGLGAMLGGIWLAQRGPIAGLTGVAMRHSLFLPVSLGVFAMLDDLAFALPCLVVSGVSMVVVAVSYQTLIQASVAPEMRGRVMSLYGMLGRGGPPLGALVMGAASESVGLQWPLAIGAAISALAWLAMRSRRAGMAKSLEDIDIGAKRL